MEEEVEDADDERNGPERETAGAPHCLQHQTGSVGSSLLSLLPRPYIGSRADTQTGYLRQTNTQEEHF